MTWLNVPEDHPFGLDNLPYASSLIDGAGLRVVVRVGDQALDLTGASAGSLYASLFEDGTLARLMAAGQATWQGVRQLILTWLDDDSFRGPITPHLHSVADLAVQLPFAIADYVDFYASEHHARNLGQLFRPDRPALTPNWKHLPIGYHGRSATVVASGTDIVRPRGQYRENGAIMFGPTRRLDLEAELGFVVGVGSRLGEPVSASRLQHHVFGVSLINDWSARDIQAWEYVPLGPFSGKSFATSMAAWITPLDALEHAWIPAVEQEPPPLPYLSSGQPRLNLDIDFTIRINGVVVSRPRYAHMYWTPGQMLAHMTVNGAALRTGDLYASGTVSGPRREEYGSLVELTRDGTEPLELDVKTTRQYLADGDLVTIDATAPSSRGRLSLGTVSGSIARAPGPDGASYL